jgi:hypothetical protein
MSAAARSFTSLIARDWGAFSAGCMALQIMPELPWIGDPGAASSAAVTICKLLK